MIPLILKLQRPQIAKFLLDWTNANENRTFDLSNENEKEEFINAITELAQTIAQTSKKSTPSVVIGDNGVQSVYLRVQ